MKYFRPILSALVLVNWVNAADNPSGKKFVLPPLPYERPALAPYISAKTLELHYSKHHQGYVDKLNNLIIEKKLTDKTLEEIIVLSAKDPQLTAVFNNAAQTWNHTFYWRSMQAMGGGKPTGKLLDKINKNFGDFREFRKQFIEAGTKVFGSGWVWLVEDGAELKIVATSNADLPLIKGQKALLVCDVWEHAYYLDYQNRRKEYVEVFLDHLVNWNFALNNMSWEYTQSVRFFIKGR
ncbi:superoxide dismutase [Candidatus Odyssella acanthamoebae]|uniref:superoxide dismutase n=1 Tax=Candidatus Odyssella acanthamoebae TaxID=91604 RepID=UPI000A0238E4|nr:superoxide dismutase [Candidatus Paracaedibacter acanthamoebae]